MPPASSAIQCRFVDTFAGFMSLPVFPANGSLPRRLPFLLRVLASPVPRSRRYYEGATTSHPRIRGRSFVCFRSPRDPPSFVCRRSAPGRSEVPSRPGPLFSRRPHTSGLLARGREWDLSGLQAIHPVPLLRSRTPVEPTCPRQCGHVDAAPAGWTAKASAKCDFGATRSFGTRCRTLHAWRCRTHARLASGRLAGLCREGFEPTGSLRKVSARVDDHPPLLLS